MTEEDTRGLAQWAAEGIEPETPPAAVVPPAPVAAEPAPEPEPTPEPVVAEAEPATEAVEGQEPTPAPTPARKPKAMEPWMKDRLAEQTAKQRDAERKASEAEARAQIAEAALEALRRGDAKPADGSQQQPPARQQPQGDYVPRSEVEAAAQRIASERAFVEQANAAYYAGKAAYTDFDDALQPLQEMGAVQRQDFQEAALATGAASDVIYHLGSNPNEASEILGLLKSNQMAKATAKMTRIAGEVAASKAAASKGRPVSKVPAPIRPVGGSAVPSVDLDKADDGQWDAEMSRMSKAGGWGW